MLLDREAEYVDNGIHRFTTGKYPTYLGCNAMMGFIVKTLNVDDTRSAINAILTVNEDLTNISRNLPDGCYKFKSEHMMDKMITLFHLWLDFSSCIKEDKTK